MSSFSEWVGAQDLRGVSMGLDAPSLDDRTAALRRRAETLLSESYELDEALERTRAALAETRGVGEAESGAIKVTVDAQNRVVDIALTAKAMRLPSTDRLRRALLTACDAAVADASKKVRKAAGVDPDADPLEAFFSGLPEIEVLLPASLRAPRPLPEAPPATSKDHDG
jgi:DNA-binding protein YbaB